MANAMVRSQRAAVVPRVLSEVSGDPFALEEMVQPYLGQAGAVAILGPAGSGKTTALAHLAAVLPGRIALFDEDAGAAQVQEAARAGLALYAGDRIHRIPHLATLLLASWGKDEALEYLMAVHRAACGDVMPRLAADPDLAMLGGSAELWCAVLDRMAGGAISVAAALAGIATRAAIGDRIYRHRVIRILRRAHEVSSEVRGGPGEWRTLSVRQEPEVIREAARLLAGVTEAKVALGALCDAKPDDRQPMAASLLLALDPEWKPRGVPRLEGAYLGGARWRAVELREAVLRDADLAGTSTPRSSTARTRRTPRFAAHGSAGPPSARLVSSRQTCETRISPAPSSPGQSSSRRTSAARASRARISPRRPCSTRRSRARTSPGRTSPARAAGASTFARSASRARTSRPRTSRAATSTACASAARGSTMLTSSRLS